MNNTSNVNLGLVKINKFKTMNNDNKIYRPAFQFQ